MSILDFSSTINSLYEGRCVVDDRQSSDIFGFWIETVARATVESPACMTILAKFTIVASCMTI